MSQELQEVRVRLFGKFRDLFPEAELTCRVTPGATCSDLKRSLASYFIAADRLEKEIYQLLEVSVLASETKVLMDSDRIPEGERLAILPPVSGG